MALPRAETSPEDHYHHAPDRTELEKALHKSREKLKPYTGQVVAAVLALVLVGGGVLLWSTQASASRSAGWEDFLKAQSKGAPELEAVANQFPNTNAGNWARLQAGRVYLQDGLAAALTDRTLSDERLKKSKDCFDKLLAGGADVPGEIREEALYGLATALEALCDGDTQAALEAFETLAKDYPESNHLPWVKARIEALKLQETKDFYAWFRKQNPKPQDRSLPGDLPSQPPPDIEIPEIKIPLDGSLIQDPIVIPDAKFPAPENTPPMTPPAQPESPPAGNPESPANPPVGENSAPANPPNAPAMP